MSDAVLHPAPIITGDQLDQAIRNFDRTVLDVLAANTAAVLLDKSKDVVPGSDKKDAASSDVKDTASENSEQVKKRRRNSVCQCIRKHPAHFEKFSHPPSMGPLQTLDSQFMVDGRPYTGLGLAMRAAKADVAEWMLAHKADINSTNNSDGGTALYIATNWDYLEGVRVLLKHKADVNLGDETNELPISAVKSMAVAQLLVEAKSDLLHIDNGNFNVIGIGERRFSEIQLCSVVFAVACRCEDTKVIRYLFESKADNVNYRNPEGWNSLMSTSQNGHFSNLEYLLSVCDPSLVNNPDQDGFTMLMMTAGNSQVECVQALLKGRLPNKEVHYALCYVVLARADPNIASQIGITALMEAAGYFHQTCVPVIELLIAANADVRARTTDADGKSALTYAISLMQAPRAAELLALHGAVVEEPELKVLTRTERGKGLEMKQAIERGQQRRAEQLLQMAEAITTTADLLLSISKVIVSYL